MDNKKDTDFKKSLTTKESEFSRNTASRARNRTVMLTPEITGEVRARLAQDFTKPSSQFSTPQTSTDHTSDLDEAQVVGSMFNPSGPGEIKASSAQGDFHGPHGERQDGEASTETMNEGVVWAKNTPLIGFLVSFDVDANGTVFELRTGRLIVTSEPAGAGNYLVINDETVSPMHAILRLSVGGEIQVLDQLSECGTKIKRFDSEKEEELSGDKSTLKHGDVIKFGNRSFNVCIIALRDES